MSYHRSFRNIQPLLSLLFLALLLAACSRAQPQMEVVIYTSVDQVFSEPILQRYEEQTGVKVLPVYDVEAAKTTGLVNRLIAEKGRPQADVFWNGEFAQTLLLKEQAVLAAYEPPIAEELPELYRDPSGYWTGFGGRARVILVNTDRVSPDQMPSSIFDLIDPARSARVGFANPLFGTTATHAAALYAAFGREQGREFFESLNESDAQLVEGNSVVRDMVANGQLDYGLTDTDDACGALQRGAPVVVVFPDQSEGGLGTLVIPNTVALVAGGPNPEQGKAFIDYLLSSQVETALIQTGWFSLSLRAGTRLADAGAPCSFDFQVRGMQVQFSEIYAQMGTAKDDLTEIFIR